MTRQWIAALSLLIAVGSPLGALGQGGTIGIYADLAGTSNEISVPVGIPVEFYILAKPNVSNTAGGVQGAEFRIKGAPDVPLLDAVVNPAVNIAFGSPFSDETLPVGSRGGCLFAFPVCQTPNSHGVVLFYTVTILTTEPLFDVVLELDGREPPQNVIYPFPSVFACNDPIFSVIEMQGVTGIINGSTVAMEGKTWSGVKKLFR